MITLFARQRTTPPPGEAVWIAVGKGAIIRSTAPTTTWTDVTPGDLSGAWLYGVADDGTAFVASGENGNIWRSVDAGLTWTQVTSPIVNEDWFSACSPEPGVLLIQSRYNIARSTDNGASFSTVSQSLTPANEFYTFATDGAGTVILGCNAGSPSDGYAYSNDSGQTWSAEITGTGALATTEYVSYANGYFIIAGFSCTVQYSTTALPGSWTDVNWFATLSGSYLQKYVWDGTYFWNNSNTPKEQLRQTTLATTPTFAGPSDVKQITAIASDGAGTTVMILYDDTDLYYTTGNVVLTQVVTGLGGEQMLDLCYRAA